MFRYVPVKNSCRDVSISAHVFARFQTIECELMSPVIVLSESLLCGYACLCSSLEVAVTKSVHNICTVLTPLLLEVLNVPGSLRPRTATRSPTRRYEIVPCFIRNRVFEGKRASGCSCSLVMPLDSRCAQPLSNCPRINESFPLCSMPSQSPGWTCI